MTAKNAHLPTPIRIRIMSHNIWGMFNRENHSIANRNLLISEIYSEYRPHIIGMQECSPASRAEKVDISALLSPTYTELDIADMAEHENVSNVYFPIFYMPDILTVIDSGLHVFDREYNNSDSKGAAWVVFERKSDKKKVAVINTHYWWKSGEEHNIARVKNSLDILGLQAKIKEKYDIPIIVMGDLNCRVESEAYKTLIKGGFRNAQTIAPETVNFSTHHAYPEYNKEKNIYENGVMPAPDYSRAIDHLLISDSHSDRVLLFDIITAQNALNSSDHCPIYADIAL